MKTQTDKQTTKPEPHDSQCQCTYCIPIVDDPTLMTASGTAARITGFAIYKRHLIDVERVGEAQNIYIDGKPIGHTYSNAAIAIGRAAIDQRLSTKQ